MDAYYKVYQIDGRVENSHWHINDYNVLEYFVEDLAEHALLLTLITEEQFMAEMDKENPPDRVFVNADLHVENDALGEEIGYIEIYTL